MLDVGSGTGRLASALADRGARVWGIDPSAEMVAAASPSIGQPARFKVARAEALPFKDGWFERAVLRLVVHLVERPRAFAELHRVLASDSKAVVATFAPESFESMWLAPYFPEVVKIDLDRFPPGDVLERDFAAAGFTRVTTCRLEQTATLTRDEALERIRERYISTLRLLDEEAYSAGRDRAERELPERVDDRRAWLIVTAEKIST